MEKERWKPILSHYGLYKVSSFGQVKSLARNGRPELILKPTCNTWGYFTVPLHKNGKGWPHFIHKLVAEAFVYNPFDKTIVNHIDGDKLNNRWDNLEWVTPSENCLHALRTGLAQRGEQKYNAKLKDSQVLEIFNSPLTIRKLAEIYNVKVNVISGVKRGINYTHITGASYAKKLVINKDEILEIFNSGNPSKMIAQEFGIPERKVHAIKNGEIFKRFTQKEYKPRIEKYSNELILLILNLNLSHKEIKNLHNIPLSTISAIKTGKCYREVTGLAYTPVKRKSKDMAA